MTAREKLGLIAISQVGQMEVGGNNLGPAVEKYQSATWCKPGPWPWCAAFCAWCMQQWYQDAEVLAELNLLPPQAEATRCKEIGVDAWIAWAKKHGHEVLDHTHLARTGDFIIFDFQQDHINDHIGIVVGDQVQGGGITTVEGNTGAINASDGKGGEGVGKKVRNDAIVSCLIRIVKEQTA